MVGLATFGLPWNTITIPRNYGQDPGTVEVFLLGRSERKKTNDKADDLQEGQMITLEKKMRAHSHHKRTKINEDHRASCIRMKKANVDAGKLKPEQDAHH